MCVCIYTHVLMHAHTREASVTTLWSPQALIHLQTGEDAKTCHPHKGL